MNCCACHSHNLLINVRKSPSRDLSEVEVSQSSDLHKMVSISEDYLAFLHDELSENQARLKQILGESQSKAIFSWNADSLIRTIPAGKNSSSIDALVQKLKDWGMSVTYREKGRAIEFEIGCPFADNIHPLLASKEPRCPLGEYILGAIRLEEPRSQLAHNSLSKEGVTLTIEKPENTNCV